MTTDGKPSGTKATRMDTAKVTVAAPLPLYDVVIPTMKKTMAKKIAMVETKPTKRELRQEKCVSKTDYKLSHEIRNESRETYISTASGLLLPDSPPVKAAIWPIRVRSPVLTTTVPISPQKEDSGQRKLRSPSKLNHKTNLPILRHSLPTSS